MVCPSNERIDEFVSGALQGVELAEVEAHIDSCMACREAVSVLVQLLGEDEPDASSCAPSSKAASVAASNVDKAAWSVPERYEIVRTLGRGAMGVVFLARDRVLRRRVALKMMRPPRYGEQLGEEAQRRFVREAQNMAQVSHRNVVAIHDYGYFDGQAFIAMEFIEGRSLREWLEEAPRSASEVIEAMRAAGEGLAAAHEAGLIHRDFKADNVLVGHDGRVCISDFGLSRDDERKSVGGDPTVKLTKTGMLIGTPRYMAPEQHVGGRANESSDQYAFCATFYEALAGRPPFEASSHRAILADKLANRVPPLPSGLPARLRAAIARGLEADSELRFASLREFLRECEERGPAFPWRAIAAATAIAAAALLIWLAVGKEPDRAVALAGEDAAPARTLPVASHAPAAPATPTPVSYDAGSTATTPFAPPRRRTTAPSRPVAPARAFASVPDVAAPSDAGALDASALDASALDASTAALASPSPASSMTSSVRLSLTGAGVDTSVALSGCVFCDVWEAEAHYVLRYQQDKGHSVWNFYIKKRALRGVTVLRNSVRLAPLIVSLTNSNLPLAARGVYSLRDDLRSTITLSDANLKGGGRVAGKIDAHLEHATSGVTMHLVGTFEAPIPR